MEWMYGKIVLSLLAKELTWTGRLAMVCPAVRGGCLANNMLLSADSIRKLGQKNASEDTPTSWRVVERHSRKAIRKTVCPIA